MKSATAKKLRSELEALRLRYDDPRFLKSDPLGSLDQGLEPADFEIVSFVAAGLSYGRVEQIRRSIDAFLACAQTLGAGASGEGLAALLEKLNPERDAERVHEAFAGWKHRLQTGRDLSALMLRLSIVLRKHGSLGAAYQNSFHDDPKEQLTAFSKAITGEVQMPRKDAPWTGWGLASFCPDPASGSACKRLLMWLRWMVRRDRIDPGTWHDPRLGLKIAPDPSRLFHPVDTHIFRWAVGKRLAKRKTPGWPLVQEITQALAQIAPEDPLRYDFAICQAGMSRFRETRSSRSSAPAKTRRAKL